MGFTFETFFGFEEGSLREEEYRNSPDHRRQRTPCYIRTAVESNGTTDGSDGTAKQKAVGPTKYAVAVEWTSGKYQVRCCSLVEQVVLEQIPRVVALSAATHDEPVPDYARTHSNAIIATAERNVA